MNFMSIYANIYNWTRGISKFLKFFYNFLSTNNQTGAFDLFGFIDLIIFKETICPNHSDNK